MTDLNELAAREAHTPGPFAVYADERSIIISTADGSVRLARMMSANGADLANAHLFTVAPELLALAEDAVPILQVLIENHQSWQRVNHMEPDDEDPALDLLARIQSLIARATGGTNDTE